jgi:hypothetical protein
MGNKHKIKLAQEDAKKRYDYLIHAYKKLQDNNMFDKVKNKETTKKMIEAQIKLHFGIYNRDYDIFKEGYDEYKLNAFENRNSRTMIVIKNGQKETEYTDITPAEYTDEKIKIYDTLYENLPFNYFINNNNTE